MAVGAGGRGVAVGVGGKGVAVAVGGVSVGSGVAVEGRGVGLDGLIGAAVGRGVTLCAVEQAASEATITTDDKNKIMRFPIVVLFCLALS